MKLFKALLILAVFNSSIPAYADSPMNQARQNVQATLDIARAKATEAVTGDYNFALSQVMQKIAQEPMTSSVSQTLLQQQTNLLEQLKQIEHLDAGQMSQLKETALAALERYKDLVRERFDLSFQAATIRDNERESLRVAIAALQQFSSNCSSGRGIGGLGETAFRYPDLPQPDVGFYVGQTSADAHYNGTGSGAEESRSKILSATELISANVAVAAYVPGAVSASSAAMCAAAAPYTLGAGLVIAAVVFYLNMSERLKMENEISDAKTFAFHGMANDQIVANFYREQCSDLTVKSQPLMQAFQTAINSPDDLEQYAGADDFVAENEQLQTLAKERESLRIQLAKAVADKDQSAMTSLSSKIAADESKIASISTPEHVAKLAVGFLISQREQMTKDLSQKVEDALETEQRKAFSKILSIIDLLQQKQFAKYLSGSEEIGQEMAATKAFVAARVQLKKTLAAQIKAIFGHLSQAELTQSQKQLALMTRSLITSYPRSADVRGFASSVTQLIGTL